MRLSVRFLIKNKDLIILPFLSLIVMIAIVSILVSTSFLELNFLINYFQREPTIFLLGGLFLYFFLVFIVLYFNASMVTCLIHRLQGNPLSIFKAMRLTLQHTGPLLEWTLLSATVCIILNALERTHDVVADIIYAIFGFSWSVTTYFVLPIMIAENIGPINAFKRSIQLIGKGWRKLLSVNFILFLILAGIIACVYLIAFLLGQTHQQIAINLPLILVLLFLWIIISKTFSTIYNSALYLTINEKELRGFDEAMLSRFMVKK
ncbi:DUF6159 family protein [Legionella brunensis]|uniref:DUF6159 family protein n=1 Tax=Legionella brunensis TaxID=29422 RepID=UPI0010418E42|nr:DUF6159 family protein [Legionella brunensis]